MSLLFDGETPEVIAAQLIFWLLLPLVLFARPQWAFLAWLIMGNLDGTGSSLAATSTSVGLVNAFKGVIIPIFLLWRFRGVQSHALRTLPGRLWMALTLYSALACLWSPFPLAAVKLVANMAGILLSVVLLERAARKGLLNSHLLLCFIIGTLSLGCLQTFYFGGAAYGFDGADQVARFSSFVGAQQYAALLVALLTAVLFWSWAFSKFIQFALLAVLGAALMINGSRTWALGACLVVVVYFFLTFRKAVVMAISMLILSIISGVALLYTMTSSGSANEETSGRIVATVAAVMGGQDTAQQVGLRTFSFRVTIYNGVLQQLRSSSVAELLFGHGTSSGALAALYAFPGYNSVDKIDPNRIVHNEWLRALFEWGVLGLALFIMVFITLIVGLLLPRGPNAHVLSAGFLAYLPALIVALSTENILAGAGNAVTMSFAFLSALLWISPPAAAVVRNSNLILESELTRL